MNDKNNVSLGYLRTFITLLVVAHHAFLAYVSFIPTSANSFLHDSAIWTGFPIVDKERWAGFDVIVLFNDTFFMSLMFFLSGLFVWQSITRKGPGAFLKDRFLRLGLPFVVVSVFLIPLAYYPSYLSTGSDAAQGSYFGKWLSLDFWPSGPCWFIGALLMFDVLAVLVWRFASSSMAAVAGFFLSARQRPGMFFLILVVVSMVASLPMLATFGPFHWFKLGPFAMQASRILLYPAWFFAGVTVGAGGIENGLLARDGKLMRRWAWWTGIALIAFAARVFFVILLKKAGSAAPPSLLYLSGFAFVLSCSAISFALLAVFLRFATRNARVWNSLDANAYGIYLVHYLPVIWVQYWFLDIALPSAEKGMAVFGLSLLASWAVIAGVRLIPAVDRILSNSSRHKEKGLLSSKMETTAF